ncbi:MAG: hypothetical protein SFZ02_21880 [bacterium]|nr:hypothetical protein [bacterium]
MTEKQSNLALTVYQGIGLVRERRKITFAKGGNSVNFTDVAASIRPESVKFVSRTDPDGTRVVEQNYVYDLVNSEALFRRFIDQTITVTAEDGTVYVGKLLSADHRVVLQSETGQLYVLRIDSLRDVQFPSLPDGLITRPTLHWLIYANQAGEHDVELTYLTDDISWNATYNLLLARDNQTVDINGWLTLTNNSGTTYSNAHLKCVAGEVNIVPKRPFSHGIVAKRSDFFEEPRDVVQRDLFEYKLYEVPHSVTMANNETKQIEFITAKHIESNIYFVFTRDQQAVFNHEPSIDRNSWQVKYQHIEVYLQFSTATINGVGADLPAGRMQVYQNDVDGSALLIGENTIKHTPKGEKVSVYLGKAFDIVGERRQTVFHLVAEKVLQETFEIKLRNRKTTERVEIRVPERLFRWSNWQILTASMDYIQKDSATIEFVASVPPNEEVVILYTVQYSW